MRLTLRGSSDPVSALRATAPDVDDRNLARPGLTDTTAVTGAAEAKSHRAQPDRDAQRCLQLRLSTLDAQASGPRTWPLHRNCSLVWPHRLQEVMSLLRARVSRAGPKSSRLTEHAKHEAYDDKVISGVAVYS